MIAQGISERRACRLIQIDRKVLHYERRVRPDEEQLRDRLRVLAGERPRFGYRRLYVLLRREGTGTNHKRVYRIYREEGLMVRKRKRKRVWQARSLGLGAPTRPNQRWSMDFVSDVVAAGRRIRALAVVDAFTRESLAIEVDTSITGERVVRVLEAIVERRGFPETIQVDNGPEFTSRALDQWAYERQVALSFIEPGKPTQNAYIESFNGGLRDECLNSHWFGSIREARVLIETWQEDYNEARPHSALGYLAPAEYRRSFENRVPTAASMAG